MVKAGLRWSSSLRRRTSLRTQASARSPVRFSPAAPRRLGAFPPAVRHAGLRRSRPITTACAASTAIAP